MEENKKLETETREPAKKRKETTADVIKRFNGNERKAIKYILSNYQQEELDEFISEWNKRQNQIAYELIKERVVKNRRFKKNPYVKPLILDLVLLSAIIVLIILGWKWLMSAVSVDSTVAELVLSVIIGLFSLRIGGNLVAAIRYAKNKE